MKGITILLGFTILSGCATSSVQISQKLVEKNEAEIKDSVAIYGISPDRSTLKMIDGKETSYTSTSNYIKAGKRKLVFESSCQGLLFTKSNGRFITNERKGEFNLIKGHTYKISPQLGQDTKTEDFICLTKFEDITISNN